MKQPRLLEHFPAVHTTNRDVASNKLFSVYGADRAEIAEASARSLLHANHLQMKDIAVSYCEYGVDARVEFPEATFLRQLFKISGSAQATAADNISDISRQNWSVLIPEDRRFGLNARASYQQLVLRLEHGALQRAAAALLGDASDQALIFEQDIDLNSLAARSLRRRVFFFAAEFDAVGDQFSDLAAAEIERTLIVNFLICHRHTFTRYFLREPADATATIVRHVEEYIEANWDQPLDVETLASIANVSARSVFRQFKKSRGHSHSPSLKK